MNVDRTILEKAEKLTPQLTEIRRAIHRHPELGFEEVKTAGLISDTLTQLDIPHRTGVGRTGIVAEVGQGKPIIALRGDMDALPITEQTGLPFASEVDGVMHACGHDAHATALLGAAMLLKQSPPSQGTVRFLFQPAEETGDDDGKSGADRMVEDGAMTNVDAVVGIHNIVDRPPGTILVSPGPVMAATEMFEVVIHGRSSHGAYPHRGIDAIVLASQVVNAIQSIVARRIDPMEAGVITVGTILGGRKANIIADRVELTGTMRSFAPEVREDILMGLENACCVARLLGGDYEMRTSKGHPATVNDPFMSQLVEDIALQLGMIVEEEKPSPVSEDFSLLARLVPGVYFLVGAQLMDGKPLRHAHHPMFELDERFLPIAAAMLAETARQYLLQAPATL